MKSLWPNLKFSDLTRTPASILKEQAASLARVTNNVVQAEVKNKNGIELGYDQSQILFDFNLVSPLLDNYQYSLFRIVYDLKQNYPVFLFIDEAYSLDLLEFSLKDGRVTINNETEFEASLKEIFNSGITINILSNLINLSSESGS